MFSICKTKPLLFESRKQIFNSDRKQIPRIYFIESTLLYRLFFMSDFDNLLFIEKCQLKPTIIELSAKKDWQLMMQFLTLSVSHFHRTSFSLSLVYVALKKIHVWNTFWLELILEANHLSCFNPHARYIRRNHSCHITMQNSCKHLLNFHWNLHCLYSQLLKGRIFKI